MKLSSIRIVTRDVLMLSRFYEAVTGVPATGNADFVELHLSGSTLAMCSVQSIAKENVMAAVSSQNRSLILEFEVADVDADRARMQTLNIVWVMEPTTHLWGKRSMLFRDPDGNLICFFSQLPAR